MLLKGLASWVVTSVLSTKALAGGYQNRLVRVALLLDGKLVTVDRGLNRFVARAMYCTRDIAAAEGGGALVLGSPSGRSTSRIAVEHGKTAMVCVSWMKADECTYRYHIAQPTPPGDGGECALVALPPWRHASQRQAVAGVRFAGIRLKHTHEVIDLTKEYKLLTTTAGVKREIALYLLFQVRHAPAKIDGADPVSISDCEFIYRERTRHNPHA